MYGNYPPAGSPPLPDIIGQYYTGGYGSGVAGAAANLPCYDMYGPSTSTGYLYDPTLAAAAGIGAYGGYGQTSPIRRRRYSIAGLPSASMMNDYYGYQQPLGPAPIHQSSSSNILNLLNEAHKSISRSSQILTQQARLQQAQQAAAQTVTPLSHYPGRVVSSYPTLHPGDTSPPYLNDNLMQMSASFSSQPNMYFQQYGQAQPPPPPAPSQMQTAVGASRLRPAYSVSNLNYLNYPLGGGTKQYPLSSSNYMTTAGSQYGGIGGGGGHNLYTNPSDLSPYNLQSLLQQRNLMSSLHASNPAISQLYQQQQQQAAVAAAQQQQSSAYQQMLAQNIQQQFAGTHHYAHQQHQLPVSAHPSAAHIHASVQQQLNPDHQFHIHQQQNHLQTHPLAALASTTAPFPATLTSSALHDVRSTMGGGAATGLTGSAAYHDAMLYPPTHHHTHLHHPSTLGQAQQHHHHHQPHHSYSTTPHHSHHQHHLSPYSKLDLDYPKLPQEHKRQVSFKFDVDTLSLDS
ncbi:protein roadkill-like [Musca vetustissima]|uniref:protein roadkill-like n=1 Tax=Musca vetustissima TaxID=27455 RepID=UPI002AB776B2|nr:protein roadkill-like [Musca vetustissima]